MSHDTNMTRAAGTSQADAPSTDSRVARCSYSARITDLGKGGAFPPLHPLRFEVLFAPILLRSRLYATCQTYLEV